MAKTKMKGGQGMKNNKTNKSKLLLIWSIVGILMFGVLASAGTTINNNGATFSTNDAVMTFNGYNSILGNGAGGINFVQTRPEAKAGISWQGYDAATNSNRYIGWIVAHYNSSSGNGAHSHISIETLDNSTGSPSINSHFAISYSSSQLLANVTFPSSNVIYTDNRGLYLDPSLGSVIKHISASDKLEISDDNAVSLKSNRLDLYTDTGGVNALRLTNDSTGIVNSVLGGTTFAISSTDMLQLKANATAMICGATTEGSLYYDGTAKKHFGCDGTNWNALY